ncbi:MAG: OB-fold nucleic acid binding domain-containing protein, partial [Cyanobacteria bacterium P01_H01_bin.15]
EKLRLEKENLGFYISEHPLKAVRKSAQILAPVNLGNLSEVKSRKKVSAIVSLNSFRQITTKKGDPMAFLQLEDPSGQCEGVVFPSAFERVSPMLEEGALLMLWGKVERRDDSPQLIVEDAEPVDGVRIVTIEMTAEEACDRNLQTNLRGILVKKSSQPDSKSGGRIPVTAVIKAGLERQFVRFGNNFWVHDDRDTVLSLVDAGFSARTEPLIPAHVIAEE